MIKKIIFTLHSNIITLILILKACVDLGFVSLKIHPAWRGRGESIIKKRRTKLCI
jgi:hypothetical protein